MAFPQSIDTAAPAGSDSPRLGDNQLRDIKQLLADLFTLPTSPSTISATIGSVSTAGKFTLTNAAWTADVIGVAYGGTAFSSYTIGDLLQASASGTLAKLLAVATGNVLLSGGVGVVSAWGKVGLATHVSGNLPVTNLDSGTSAGATTFWRGDGTWGTPAGAGSVTSVAQSFTGGLLSVAGSPITTSGTLALTVAGTSGGIPYFSGATAWASSGALTASALVLGGGAGAAPTPMASLGTTTTLLHGNAAGAPTFGAVSLTADVTGDLPYANLAQATAASKLLGRGSAAGSGDWEEVTLGTNLSFSGTTLNASGGAVSSVSNVDGGLTISPTTGAVVASLALGHANSWTGQQSFDTWARFRSSGGTICGYVGSAIDIGGGGGSADSLAIQSNSSFYLTTSGNATIKFGVTAGDGCVIVGPMTTMGGASIALAISNADAAPSTNPTGGGILYASAGALKWRGSSGTVTTIAAA